MIVQLVTQIGGVPPISELNCSSTQTAKLHKLYFPKVCHTDDLPAYTKLTHWASFYFRVHIVDETQSL